MKQIAIMVMLVVSMMRSAVAETDLTKLITGNQNSPEAITSIKLGTEGKLIWIFYHAPSIVDPKSKEKRHIFNGAGALQPDGTVWRLGADFATVLHTDTDLDIGGLAVPKGEYTLYVDLDKGNWKLIVNRQLMNAQGTRPQWGINRDGSTTNVADTEVGRTALTMAKPAQPAERMKIAITRTDQTHGTLTLTWENMTASVPVAVK